MMSACGNTPDALLLPLVPNPAQWPSDALLEAVMRACTAPPDRSGILPPSPCLLAPTLTASCPAGGGGAPSHSRQELPVPLGGAGAGVNADYNAANNIFQRALKG